MENTEIQPALSPDEWRGGELQWPTVALSTTSGGDLVLWDGELGDDSDCIRITDAQERHAVAALALYKQPFGFTHEDVAILREVSHARQATRERVENGLASLADRITALLPPA